MFNSQQALKEYKESKKSQRFCHCGNIICEENKTDYCALCDYIGRHPQKWRKPILVDAGYFLIINSKMCEGRSRVIGLNIQGYHNRDKKFIYINMKEINKDSKPIERLVFVMSHEYLHFYLYNNISALACGQLDNKYMRDLLDEYI